jgi:hypothetical protein
VIGQCEIRWPLTFAGSPLWGAAVSPRTSALAFHDVLQLLFHQDSMTLRAGAIPHGLAYFVLNQRIRCSRTQSNYRRSGRNTLIRGARTSLYRQKYYRASGIVLNCPARMNHPAMTSGNSVDANYFPPNSRSLWDSSATLLSRSSRSSLFAAAMRSLKTLIFLCTSANEFVYG